MSDINHDKMFAHRVLLRSCLDVMRIEGFSSGTVTETSKLRRKLYQRKEALRKYILKKERCTIFSSRLF